jgi:polyisoprenoid-binding protein YceI
MKTTTFKSLAVFVLALSLTTSVFAGTQKVDAAKSTVKWLGKKVTGEHTGTIALKEGNLVSENGKITSGKIVMDMTSIVDKDLTDAEWNAKLIGHLKSDDFFAVATNPTSELVLTKVEVNGSNYVFAGNLTIKGITNPVSFKATSSKDGKNTNFVGSLTIDRTKFNMKFGSKSFFENLGDKVVYDDFTLDFNLVVAE